MSNHTQGPWAVYPLAPMSVHQPEYQCWIPQNEADARLIAAAPDLLVALKVLADYVDERAGDNECRPLENARTAIAKAVGEKE